MLRNEKVGVHTKKLQEISVKALTTPSIKP